MKKAVVFTFEDYWEALDGAGPKTKESILCRAENDPSIDFSEFKKLTDKVYPCFED